MSTVENIGREFEELIQEAKAIMQACGWDGSKYYQWPADTDYFRFRTRALNLVRRVCGEGSEHHLELRRLAEGKESATRSSYLGHCLGVVEAAKRDFEAGLLFNVRSLIAAELLGDFIEQAELLVSEGYHVPAASLAGAVLEDTLRKLCEVCNIAVPAKTKLDRLNADLAKAGVYDKLIQKRITALADVRNSADHGHFDKFTREDVIDMVKWVRRFTADYLR